MTALDDNLVSKRLVQPLQIVQGRARLLAWLRAVFMLVALCAAVWLVVALIMGSSLQIPLWIAIPLAVLGWAAVIYGGYRIVRPLFKRRGDLAAAAWLADGSMPDSEERITSAVELQQEKDSAFRGSPELIAVLVRQAEHHADTMDPGQVISGKEVMRWLSAAGVVVVVWLLLLVVFTPNVLLGMQRMFAPWKAADPLAGPVLEVTPGDVVTAQGTEVPVKVKAKAPEGLSFDAGHADAKATLVQQFLNFSGEKSPEVLTPIPCTLDTADERVFVIDLNNVQQSFTYKVVVEASKNMGRGESPEYTVTVQSRPAVADMELVYTYPAYTGQNPRTDHSREGVIEALVGTKVKVILHATEPVKTAELAIADDGSGPRTLALVPVEGVAAREGSREAAYAGEFTILKSSEYRVHLVKEDGRDNADAQQPRPIHARPDNAPTVGILVPDPKAGSLAVRPDDVVPMKFVANDDYGISKVEALVQVDDRPERSIVVPVEPGQMKVNGDWELRVADVLKSVVGGAAPKRVSYQFRATDNRDPNPQTGLSGKQYLDLDKNATPLAQRRDQQAAKELANAIEQAAAKLKDAQSNLGDVIKNDKGEKTSAADAEKLDKARQDMAAADDMLRGAADKADSSRLGQIADAVRDIADHPMKQAEDDASKSQLATDQGNVRRSSEAAAQVENTDAINRLAALNDAIKKAAQNQPLAQALERMAAEQRRIAEALAKNPNDPQALADQKKLQADLDKLIKENPELQKPAEDANAAKLADLVNEVHEIEQAQQPIGDQLNNVVEAQHSADQARELAQKQEELNKQIGDFNQRQENALKNAGAKGPDQAKQEQIVKELQGNQASAASRDEKAAAAALDQAAEKLNTAQKNADNAGGARQGAAAQAAQDAKDAGDLQKQAGELAQDIQKAKAAGNPPTYPGDPANKEASALADQIKQEAQKIAQRSPANSDARNAAQNAIKQADAAKASETTQNVNADKAQQQLADAAGQLAQAAKAEQGAAGNNATPGQPNAAAAAKEAQALAGKQNDLADQAAQLARSQEDATTAKANSEKTAEQQRQVADKIDQAAKDAAALQKQTQGSAPAMADKVAQAQQALQKAAQAQQQAAQAARGSDSAGAAAQQDQAADRVGDADQALTGQRPQRTTARRNQQPNDGPKANQNNTGQQAGKQNQGQQNQGGQANTGQNQAGQSGQSRTQNAGGQQAGNQGNGQSGGAQQGAAGQAGGGQQQNAGQSGNGAQANGAQQNGGGQNQNGQGGQNGQSGQSQGGQANQNGQPGQGQSGQASAGRPGNATGVTSPIGMGGQKTIVDPNGQAAQAVQGARSSQAQAANGSAAAANQAADQLAQASQQLMGNQPGHGQNQGEGQSQGQGQGQSGSGSQMAMGQGQGSGQSQGQGNGQGQGQGQGQGSAQGPGQGSGKAGPGSGGGNYATTEGPRELPKEVQEVGVAPSDWVKLSPEMQSELIHAAQQPGPPGYRDMIKNYYSKIARMPAQEQSP